MDRNTELLLATARQVTRWEDEEKATNDVEELREEFRRRLYGGACVKGAGEQADGAAGTESKSGGVRLGC
jgi:hypothetical protein